MSYARGLAWVATLFAVASWGPAYSAGVVDGPTLIMDPFGVAPLTARVDMVLDTPAAVRLSISHDAESRTVDFPAALVHRLPVLGLKPARTYTVSVDLVPGGRAGVMLATTGPLPDDFPTLVTHVSQPELMEPGYVQLDCFFRARDDERLSYTIIVDAAGEVVWYSQFCLRTPHRLPNGHLLYQSGDQVQQIDLLGRRHRLVVLQDPGAGLHHDLFPTPHGTMLGLSYVATDVEDFPTSATDPAAPTEMTQVRDEPVVEFFPDGTLRRMWPLLEMLDPTRIAYDSLNDSSNGVDWVHTNAVTYRFEDDSIVVSGRHQDAVFKFSRSTGKLQWILGNHENWSPEFQEYLLDPVSAPFRWQYHQHAPMWTGNGTLLLFDNGNHRASPFDGTEPLTGPESFSRAVEFEIDPDLMQVRQVWEFGEERAESIFSWFISDADWQPQTGNRLITFGGVSHLGGVPAEDLGLGTDHARIVETTADTPATEVFDMTVYDPTGGRLAIYRSEKLPDLYESKRYFAPHGIGPTLWLDRSEAGLELSWLASPVDSEHSAADYYIVYGSGAASAGFTIEESIAGTDVSLAEPTEALRFYAVVAANSAGTSGDEPTPAGE